MQRALPLMLRAVALALVFSVAAAAAGAVDIMPVAKVREGMTGKGRTVFRGRKIEQFDVKILGVLRNILPNGSVILARVDAPQLRGGGVVSGMSGSPVYVRGKLIGAIAFGWPYSREPICGITPIEDMLATLRREEKEETRLPASPPVAEPATEDALAADTRLRPIMTPVMVSCWSDRLMRKLAPQLARFGMVPVQAGGSDTSGAKNAPAGAGLRPGAAYGIQLIGGDLDAIAIGTVTWCDGERVLGFGHKFLDSGNVALPMAGARVFGIMPSRRMSFKLAGGTGVIGTVNTDRAYGVGGRLGVACATIPCEVRLRSGIDGKDYTYRYELARHPDMTPMLAGWAVAASYERSERAAGRTMADLRFEAWFEETVKPFVLENVFFDQGTLVELLTDYGNVLGFLLRNPFQPAHLKRLSVTISLRHGRETAIIEGMHLSRRVVRPGESITVTVRLLPYTGGKLAEETFEIKVPETVREGMRLPLLACDGPTSMQIRLMNAPGAYRPRSLQHLISLFESIPNNRHLFLHLMLPDKGLTLRGARLPDLPSSLLGVLGDSNETGPEPMRGSLVKHRRTPWVLNGAVVLPVYTAKE